MGFVSVLAAAVVLFMLETALASTHCIKRWEQWPDDEYTIKIQYWRHGENVGPEICCRLCERHNLLQTNDGGKDLCRAWYFRYSSDTCTAKCALKSKTGKNSDFQQRNGYVYAEVTGKCNTIKGEKKISCDGNLPIPLDPIKGPCCAIPQAEPLALSFNEAKWHCNDNGYSLWNFANLQAFKWFIQSSCWWEKVPVGQYFWIDLEYNSDWKFAFGDKNPVPIEYFKSEAHAVCGDECFPGYCARILKTSDNKPWIHATDCDERITGYQFCKNENIECS